MSENFHPSEAALNECQQIELFSTAEFLAEDELENAVIDAALHHVENQSVLRQLQAGKSFGEAFGMGGSSHPVSWMADSKGIEMFWATDKARLIKPAQIIARAKQYQPKPIDPNRPF